MKYNLKGYDFEWDEAKSKTNLKKHGISFEEACEVFFDPFYRCEHAGGGSEERWGLIGYSESDRILYVVSVEKGDEAWRIISARKATKREQKTYEEED